MYICNCNGLNEQKVLESVECGATTARQIFKMNDCKPQCAKCVCEMQEFISSTSKSFQIAAE